MTISVIGAGTGNAELSRQHMASLERKARLYGWAGARPGANMPRKSEVTHYGAPRKAVDYGYALRLVCEDQQITPDQMLNSKYSAAVAARHMLWTVLLDGGHPATNIARIFKVDNATVAAGIKSFRDFQKGVTL